MNRKIHEARGYASVFVVVSHLCFFYLASPSLVNQFLGIPVDNISLDATWFSLSIFAGQLGVGIFFCITGFLMPHLIWQSRARVLGFLERRFLRLYPVYIAGFILAVILFTLISYFFHGDLSNLRFDYLSVLAHFLLGLRDLFGTVNIDGIVWTLEIEIKYYLFAALFYKYFRPTPLSVISFFSLLSVPGVLLINFNSFEIPHSIYLFLLGFWLISFGSLVRLVYDRNLSILSGLLWLVPMLFFWVIFPEDINLPIGKSSSVINIYAVSGGLFLVILYCGQYFENRISKFLGDISYPLYVVHAPIGYASIVYFTYLGIDSLLVCITLAFFCTITLAYFIHAKIEFLFYKPRVK